MGEKSFFLWVALHQFENVSFFFAPSKVLPPTQVIVKAKNVGRIDSTDSRNVNIWESDCVSGAVLSKAREPLLPAVTNGTNDDPAHIKAGEEEPPQETTLILKSSVQSHSSRFNSQHWDMVGTEPNKPQRKPSLEVRAHA